MTSVTLKISLPEPVAQAAQSAGLLTAEGIKRLIEKELSRRLQVTKLFAAMECLSALDLPTMTEDEIEAEIADARRARRS